MKSQGILLNYAFIYRMKLRITLVMNYAIL